MTTPAPEGSTPNVYMPNCKHCGRVIYWHAAGMWAHYDDATARCDIRATPDDSPAPASCSEVVERLAVEIVELSLKAWQYGAYFGTWDDKQAAKWQAEGDSIKQKLHRAVSELAESRGLTCKQFEK